MTKLKAYAVLEDCENTGGIIFARHSIVALRHGASQFGDGDIDGWRATRAQWADKYAKSRRVPQSVMLENGWNFECHGCGERIDLDWLDERDLPVSGVIGFDVGPTYCCSACEEKDARRKERVAAARAAGLAMLCARLLERFPDAEVVQSHAYACDHKGLALFEEGTIYFNWPGMKIGRAEISIRRGCWAHEQIGPLRPVVWCCAGDKEAFEAYAKWADDMRATEAQPS